MSKFSINLTNNIGDRLAAWAERYVSQTSLKSYERACAFVMDETAEQVAVTLRDVAADVLDQPTPWTVRGFQYRRALGKGRSVSSGLFSEFFVMDDQSIVLKYHMGLQKNTRYPGDVGLANEYILLPAWKNLAKTQGIKPNRYGNLPGSTMERFRREAANDRNKRRNSPNSGGIFKKEVVINGSPAMAYINRPKRVRAEEEGFRPSFMTSSGKLLRQNMRNTDRPRVLLYAVSKAYYKPRLQGVWDEAVDLAVRKIPDRMAGELAENLHHMAMKGGR